MSKHRSPIEQQLALAIRDEPTADFFNDFSRDDMSVEWDYRRGLTWAESSNGVARGQHVGSLLGGTAFLFPQVRVDGYVVDFLLADGLIALAIDCDGHEWHERTKQQAAYDRARDRALVRAGAFVIRFTGSEIHRDAEQCAKEVVATWHAVVQRCGYPVRPLATFQPTPSEARD